jgi:hypothetical protein
MGRLANEPAHPFQGEGNPPRKSSYMPAETPLQAPITDRLDAALDAMVKAGELPRAIYLTPADYAQFALEETAAWQGKLGTKALFVPLSHDDVPIIAEHLIDKVEVPVRQCVNVGKRGSAVYSATGRCILLDLVELL